LRSVAPFPTRRSSDLAEFERGVLVKEEKETETTQRNGTAVSFVPDSTIFRNYRFVPEFIENMIWNYAYLNAGLTLQFNGQKFHSDRKSTRLNSSHVKI